MRILAFGLSAVLLSGCSWLGGKFGGNGHNGPQQSAYYTQQGNTTQKHYSYNSGGLGGASPCQIPTPNHPVPRGCDPASVTVGTAGGFPQQPQYGGGQYTQGGYGSHAGDAQAHADYRGQRAPQLRKPKFRGQLTLGAEKSISGSVIDYAKVAIANPTDTYDPNDYNESSFEGTRVGGTGIDHVYFAENRVRPGANPWDVVNRPSVSLDDAWATPAGFQVGGEYILNNRTTLFANAGVAKSEGEDGELVTIEATLYDQTTDTVYDQDGLITSGPTLRAPTFIPNQTIARFAYDFSDMTRYDLEIGARQYFKPLGASLGTQTVTPFVGASVGASHYNEATVTATGHQQLYYSRPFLQPESEDLYYQVENPGGPQVTQLYNAQWVPQGQLNAGIDWQLTPKTALALETGIRIEGAREYSTGEKGDTNISIPLKIRGSYNF